MKKITLAIVAIGTLVGTPALALPPPSATYNWTGFYFGANGGAASAQTSWQYFTVPGNAFISSTPEATSGGLAGGTVGFNYQFGPNMVGGLEADWDWAGLNQSNSCPNPAFSCQVKMGDLGTARARLGWASGPALIYVTGGAAWSNLTIQTVLGGVTTGTTAERVGYSFGGGVEWGFWNNWSLKLEYLHYDLGAGNFNVDAPASQYVRAEPSGDLFRLGLNWRFNLAGPSAMPLVTK